MNETIENKMCKKSSPVDFCMVITTILCLIPLALGLFLWNKLPEQIPTTYGFNDSVSNMAPKWVTVILLPLIETVFNIIIHLGINLNKKNNAGKKLNYILKWLAPVLSISVTSALLLKPLYNKISIGRIAIVVISLLFIILGNYLPKSEPNYMVGFRVPWTLANETVWKKTHRFCGFIMVIFGFISLIGCFTPFAEPIGFVCILAAIIIPLIYSVAVSAKENKNKNKN